MLYLNIAGSEWVIIIFVAIVLILGTKKLPDMAKRLGSAVSEYNKAKDGIKEQLAGARPPDISGPVESERQKLESIARSIGIDTKEKTDEQLRDMIADKMD